jgi:hypothetical protein
MLAAWRGSFIPQWHAGTTDNRSWIYLTQMCRLDAHGTDLSASEREYRVSRLDWTAGAPFLDELHLSTWITKIFYAYLLQRKCGIDALHK